MMRMRETMAERPESMKDVPEMRLRGDDVSRIMEFYACWDSLEKLASNEDFCRRVKLIPGGLRDLKMLRSKIAKLADGLAWTIPQEKITGFMRTLKRMRYSVVQGPLASKPKGNDEELVTTQELDELAASAWEFRCKLCADGDCNRCELGRVLDNIVARDRDGRSWSMMDIIRKGA